MGTLYVVGTPIGHLEDITLRALRVLKEVDLIAAEDTRTTRKLLTHYDIHTPLTSYHDQSGPAKRGQLLDSLAEQEIALVSEAGMPGLSDPGYKLIREAIERGIPVVPVPGPSAPITAMAVSGLPTESFLFLGFLPRRRGERRRLLASVAHEPHTLIAFEAPHRLQASLKEIEQVLGDRQVAIARELTKLFEEVWRGSLREAIAHFEETPPRGEFTLVIAGAEESAWSERQVRDALAERVGQGLSGKERINEVAEMARWPRREVYRLWLEVKEQDDDQPR
jgi:16S rRNA (cytidine1402-2'-O)-methyltransferase